MSRLPRLYLPGLPQLVVQRGNNRLPVFIDETDFEQYRQHLREAGREAGVALHAYVLMSDHVHLLVTPSDEKGVGSMMQRLGRRYVRWFNDRHQRSGTLWEGRYRSTVLAPAAYLLACYAYVELNPLRAGLVSDPALYPWSSCRHHLGLERDPLITDHALFWALGNTPFERQAAYRQLLDSGTPAEQLAAIRYAGHRGWALGELPAGAGEATPNRRIAPLAKGRPRRASA